jgi:hypothetical protein
MTFELDPKASRFLVAAIQSKIAELTNLQTTHPKDENVVADASNDIMYYLNYAHVRLTG